MHAMLYLIFDFITSLDYAFYVEAQKLKFGDLYLGVRDKIHFTKVQKMIQEDYSWH